MGWLSKLLGIDASAKGGKTDVDVGTIYWDDVRRILELDEEFNRYNRMGPFGGWQYDPETKTQQFVATDPGMQAAQARMSRRLAGEGFTPYEAPAQISAMTDALMANRMERMGLLNEQTRPNLTQENYGTRFGDRQGSGWASRLSPFEVQPPGQGTPPPAGSPSPSPVGGGGVPPRPPGIAPPRFGPPYYHNPR